MLPVNTISNLKLSLLLAICLLSLAQGQEEASVKEEKTNFMSFKNKTLSFFDGFKMETPSPDAYDCLDALGNATFQFIDLKKTIAY